MLGATVFGVQHPAAATASLPTSGRHLDIEAQPFWFTADLCALLFPDLVMPVSRTNQGMRDFVKQRIPHRNRAVALGEVKGQLNALGPIEAEPHGRLSPVEGKGPIVEVVDGQHLVGLCADFGSPSNRCLGHERTTGRERHRWHSPLRSGMSRTDVASLTSCAEKSSATEIRTRHSKNTRLAVVRRIGWFHERPLNRPTGLTASPSAASPTGSVDSTNTLPNPLESVPAKPGCRCRPADHRGTLP